MARRDPDLKRAAPEAGAHSIAVVTDVTRRAEVERLREAALQMFGQVDVWVNNAGRGIGRSVLDLTDADFDEMMNVNVKAMLYGMQAIIPHFQARGEGHLVNITSFLGRVPLVPQRSAYSAAKAALNALTANLRMDLRAAYPNIHVSLVIPSIVATDFSKNALHGSPSFPGGGRGFQFQSPEEVATLIAALIEKPQAELYTNPTSAETVARYYQDVGAFEDAMMRRN